MSKKNLDLFLAPHLPKHLQYPLITMIWCICVLIFDVVILKQFYFLLVIFFFEFFMIFPRNACFLCAMCGNVTALFSFAPKYTVQNPLWKRQLCHELINLMIKNNLLHKSGAKSTLCSVAMKGFPLSSHIFIRTWRFVFAVTWCLSATSMYLFVSYNDHGMKSETSGVIWHVTLEYKIQLVNCELSLYFSLERSSLLDIRAIDAYIFWSSLFFPLSHAKLPFSIKFPDLISRFR